MNIFNLFKKKDPLQPIVIDVNGFNTLVYDMRQLIREYKTAMEDEAERKRKERMLKDENAKPSAPYNYSYRFFPETKNYICFVNGWLVCKRKETGLIYFSRPTYNSCHDYTDVIISKSRKAALEVIDNCKDQFTNPDKYCRVIKCL